MPTTKLTAKFMRDATALPGKKRTTFWDETLPGFGLSVSQGGHKSYLLQYRVGQGRAGIDRRMTLNGGMALEDARRPQSGRSRRAYGLEYDHLNANPPSVILIYPFQILRPGLPGDKGNRFDR
jgi:hypothetical protein